MKTALFACLLLAAVNAQSAALTIPRIELPALDTAKLDQQDRAADSKSVPYRYGVKIDLKDQQRQLLSVAGGQWQLIKGGQALWQGEVFAKGATSVDVVLKPFWLPQNATLSIKDGTGKLIWGPFGHEQNNLANTLPLPMVPGETFRLEVIAPNAEKDLVQLGVESVVQGYRDFNRSKSAGGCNVDAVCPAGDPYRDQSRGVARILIGGGACTGTLINNTRSDRAPLLITANHCQINSGNVANVVALYNYQSSTCRPVMSSNFGGLPAPGSPTQLGAALLASSGRSDVTLIRLNGSVPENANAFWLGWDRRDLAPSGGAAVIHHPQGEEKRIAVENDPLQISSASQSFGPFSLSAGTALIAPNWNVGTTEPGSSGSSLLTRDTKRIIGTLSGGDASCAGSVNNGGADYFGRLFTGWEGENTPSTRLKDHLDPIGSAPQVLDGIGLCNAPTVSIASSLSSPSSRDDVTYTATATGGAAPYTYSWDVDGDGVDDRKSTSNSITTRYDRALSIEVRVRVLDAAGCGAQVTRAVNVSAPDLRLESAGSSEQICGDGDAVFDPGERWRLRANVKNFSADALNGLAQFAPVSGAGGLADPDAAGYRYSDVSSLCGSSYVDISSETPLTLTPSSNFNALDDGRSPTLALGANAFEYYSENVSTVAMSTNGYLIVNPTTAIRGGDIRPNCGNTPGEDPGRRIRILHRDLVATSLRAAARTSCPRASSVGSATQPCVIFDWAGMRFLNAAGTVESGNFDMQVLVYPQTKQLVYQFRGTLPSADLDSSVSGLMNTNSSAYNYMCNTQGPGRVAAGKSVCFFNSANLPPISSLIVTKGAGVLGAVASGQSVATSTEVKIPTEAACGSTLGLGYIAGTDDRSVSTVQARLNLTLGTTCNVVNSCALPAQIPLRGGSFYNTARGGNGLVAFIIPRSAPQTPLFFGAWFTGEPDRNSSWYIVSGDVIGNQVNAQILRTKRDVSAATFTVTNSEVGRAQISLIAPERFLFSYQFSAGPSAGRSGAELMQHLFTGLPTAQPNITGHYFNPNESGWGQTYESFISNNSAQQFALTYLYDAVGEPRWTLGSFADNLSNGPVSTYEVHCPGCAWLDITPTTKSAGTLTRAFPNGFGNATVSTQFSLPSPLAGSWIKNAVNLTAISANPATQSAAPTQVIEPRD